MISSLKMAGLGLLLALPVMTGKWPDRPPDQAMMAAEPIFRDVTAQIGLDFVHDAGVTGRFLMPEIMGAGAAVLDFDGDGDLDLFLVQGGELARDEGAGKAGPVGRNPGTKQVRPAVRRGHRLYRNEFVPTGRLTLTDVSDRAGVDGRASETYGMGVAVGDIDSDGDSDLIVTGYGSILLYRNNGNGTFTESARESGIDARRWSTSAAFLDYDRDGDLDLYIANYVDFTVAGSKRCTAPTGEPDYCTPAAYRPVPDLLFQNDGSGRFTDVTSRSGIGSIAGPGLGVTVADFDQDGWVDIYVANDGAANLLWLNQKDGTFVENGLLSGAAYAMNGIPRAGMGATAGDFDNDGDPDILVTNLAREGFTLFRNNGRGLFDDYSDQVDLTRSSFRSTGFGVSWFDYDNDGWLDIFSANGAVTIVEKLKRTDYPYHQPNQLFHNEGGGKRLREIVAAGEPTLQVSEVSRGAAFGDIDNDGDVDILVSNNRGRARLLLNQTRQSDSRRHWLMVRLRAEKGNREGIGAVVTIKPVGGQPLSRLAHTDGSYLSASDPRVIFGLGEVAGVEWLTVKWPDGREQIVERPQIDRILTVSH